MADETLTLTAPPNAGKTQPKNRMSDHKMASDMITGIERQHFSAIRDEHRRVQDEYDREPPEDDGALAADGYGHATNVNWGTMAARVDEAVEPLWNLAMEGDTYLDFRTQVRGQPQVMRQFDILADAHKEMVDEWYGYGDEMQRILFNRTLFGLGIAYFDKPYGWHHTSVHPSNFIFVPGSSINIDTHSWVALRASFDVPELVQFLKAPETASQAGWNVSALKTAIKKFGDGSIDSDIDRIERGDLEHIPNDLAWSHTHQTSIEGYRLLVREWDNTITEHILIPDEEVGYIFTKGKRYDKMSDAIRLFIGSIGEGVLDKVRGYGAKTLPFHDAFNLLGNHEIDVGLLGASLIVQPADANSLDRIEEIRFGPMTVLPPGVQAQQQAFQDPGGGLREIKADMRRNLAGMNSTFGGAVDLGSQEKTAREAVLNFQQANQHQSFAIDRFRRELDAFAEIHWERVIEVGTGSKKGPGDKEAKEMFAQAEALGFFPEALSLISKVKYRTSAGDGNRVNTVLALEQIRWTFPTMTTDGQREFVRRYSRAAIGDNNVPDAFYGDGGASGVGGPSTRQVNDAQLENAAIESSSTGVAVTDTDDHLVHLQVHLEFAQQKGALLEGGGESPESILRLYTRMLEHVGPHIQAASQGIAGADEGEAANVAKATLAQVMEGFSQVENTRRQLEQQLQAAAEAQQNQQQQVIQDAMAAASAPGPKEQSEIAMVDEKRRQQEESHQQGLRHSEEEQALKLRDLVGRTGE